MPRRWPVVPPCRWWHPISRIHPENPEGSKTRDRNRGEESVGERRQIVLHVNVHVHVNVNVPAPVLVPPGTPGAPTETPRCDPRVIWVRAFRQTDPSSRQPLVAARWCSPRRRLRRGFGIAPLPVWTTTPLPLPLSLSLPWQPPRVGPRFPLVPCRRCRGDRPNPAPPPKFRPEWAGGSRAVPRACPWHSWRPVCPVRIAPVVVVRVPAIVLPGASTRAWRCTR
mmetsp:Transcript_17302/g.35859  ORF Transcript_17302/g.35859 Transcript_17302/m.35859 type:complete len:224 (+) Transcript_17302:1759-2430(+)